MKKEPLKKKKDPTPKAKGARPVEFDRGWHELEAQHDRIKSDWISLVAQLGVSGKDDE